jgi:hypothetical protein
MLTLIEEDSGIVTASCSGKGHQMSSRSPKRGCANAVACHSCAVARHGVLRHHRDGINQARGHADKPGATTRGDYAPGGVASASGRLRDGLGADGAVSQVRPK